MYLKFYPETLSMIKSLTWRWGLINISKILMSKIPLLLNVLYVHACHLCRLRFYRKYTLLSLFWNYCPIIYFPTDVTVNTNTIWAVSCLNMHLNTLYKVLTRLFTKRSVFLSAVSCLTYFLFSGPQIPKTETVFQTMGFAVVYIFFLH